MSYDCYCDYDPPSVFNSTIVKRARKEHRCDECGSAISTGQPYEHVWGVWEGNPDTFKTCEPCHDLRKWVQNSVPCFCWCYGNVIEDAKEAISEAVYRAGQEVAGLRFGFLRRLYRVKHRGVH